MVVLINSFQMRYFGYLYILSMIHNLDLPRPRFHENQELKLRYILAESPCVSRLEPLYTLLSESSLVDFVSISHTAKRLPPKIRICLVCYQKEIWSKQHGSNWGLQESQIRHSFSQVSEIFQISVDLASFQLLEKLKKVCPRHVQVCPSGNFPTFI